MLLAYEQQRSTHLDGDLAAAAAALADAAVLGGRLALPRTPGEGDSLCSDMRGTERNVAERPTAAPPGEAAALVSDSDDRAASEAASSSSMVVRSGQLTGTRSQGNRPFCSVLCKSSVCAVKWPHFLNATVWQHRVCVAT
jgi:hypothetical protein